MAEILIPIVALAGAAVLSSMDKKKQLNIQRENFTNYYNTNTNTNTN